MNNFFTQLKDKARATKLSHDEKQVVRVRLYNYLEQNPIGTFTAPAKIPKPMPSQYFFFSPRYMVPIALLLVVGLSGGTALAAQGALPGNPLYAIKINVNEPMQVALATTPAAKAEVQAHLATTRLEEAETLASNGRLDATTTAALASNFAEHAQRAQAATQAIESNDPGTAAQLDATFNSSLEAHGAILAQIGDNAKSDETMQNSNSLAIAVQQETERGNHEDQDNTGSDNNSDGTVVAIASATPQEASAPTNGAPSNTRVLTFAAVAPTATSVTDTSAASSGTTTAKAKGKALPKTATPNDIKIAASLGAQASSSIATTAADFAAIRSSLDANTSLQIAAQIASLSNAYASASAESNAGNASATIRDMNTVIRMSVKIDTYLKAGKRFNLKILSGLLGNTNGSQGSSDGEVKGAATSNDGSQNSGGNDSGKTPDSHGGGSSSANAPTITTPEDHSGKDSSNEGDVKVELHL